MLAMTFTSSTGELDLSFVFLITHYCLSSISYFFPSSSVASSFIFGISSFFSQMLLSHDSVFEDLVLLSLSIAIFFLNKWVSFGKTLFLDVLDFSLTEVYF